MIQNKLGQKHQQNNQNSGGPQEGGLEPTSSQEVVDQNRISRKMAQTYLSGLSKGFITNIDNLKFINTCLHQENQNVSSTATST